MNDDLPQLRWEGCVDQAVEDIKLLVNATNDLYQDACEAEQATATEQYHRFRSDVDGDELIRTANSLKHEVGNRVTSIQRSIERIRHEISDLGRLASQHRSSVG